MADESLLAIDAGTTGTKVVVFGRDGLVRASASAPSQRDIPAPGRAERDADVFWHSIAGLIREALEITGLDPTTIAAVGVTGHGDGLLLVDADDRPLGPMILSSDTRSLEVLARWAADGRADEAARLSGIVQLPGLPAPLTAWLAEHEPDRLAAARRLVTPTQWIRFRLTGEWTTERADASSFWVDARTEHYSADLAALLDAPGAVDLLDPMRPAETRAGEVTPEAATATTLAAGTPVAVGTVDTLACMLGSGGWGEGIATVVSGTFGTNVTVVHEPLIVPGLTTRLGLEPGTWTLRRTSTAAAANVNWFLRTSGRSELPEQVAEAIDEALERTRADRPLYLPFLFGGPADRPSGASFVDVRDWHDFPDMLSAVLEGVALNHAVDLGLVREHATIERINLCGGASRSAGWVQLFSDALDLPIAAAPGDEAAARGAAMCAAVVARWAGDLDEAVRLLAPTQDHWLPSTDLSARLSRFRLAVDSATALRR